MKKFFQLLWKGWKKFAHVLGIVNTRILLTLSYMLIIAVASVLPRIFGADFLDKRRKEKKTFWNDREQHDVSLEACRRQF